MKKTIFDDKDRTKIFIIWVIAQVVFILVWILTSIANQDYKGISFLFGVEVFTTIASLPIIPFMFIQIPIMALLEKLTDFNSSVSGVRDHIFLMQSSLLMLITLWIMIDGIFGIRSLKTVSNVLFSIIDGCS